MSDWSGLINGYLVEICLDSQGYWMNDKVIIHNPDPMEDEDDFDSAFRLPHRIMQYLYDEGLIKDRRTKFQVIRVGPPDNKKT